MESRMPADSYIPHSKLKEGMIMKYRWNELWRKDTPVRTECICTVVSATYGLRLCTKQITAWSRLSMQRTKYMISVRWISYTWFSACWVCSTLWTVQCTTSTSMLHLRPYKCALNNSSQSGADSACREPCIWYPSDGKLKVAIVQICGSKASESGPAKWDVHIYGAVNWWIYPRGCRVWKWFGQ